MAEAYTHDLYKSTTLPTPTWGCFAYVGTQSFLEKAMLFMQVPEAEASPGDYPYTHPCAFFKLPEVPSDIFERFAWGAGANLILEAKVFAPLAAEDIRAWAESLAPLTNRGFGIAFIVEPGAEPTAIVTAFEEVSGNKASLLEEASAEQLSHAPWRSTVAK